jgi:hypothetical protein
MSIVTHPRTSQKIGKGRATVAVNLLIEISLEGFECVGKGGWSNYTLLTANPDAPLPLDRLMMYPLLPKRNDLS